MFRRASVSNPAGVDMAPCCSVAILCHQKAGIFLLLSADRAQPSFLFINNIRDTYDVFFSNLKEEIESCRVYCVGSSKKRRAGQIHNTTRTKVRQLATEATNKALQEISSTGQQCLRPPLYQRSNQVEALLLLVLIFTNAGTFCVIVSKPAVSSSVTSGMLCSMITLLMSKGIVNIILVDSFSRWLFLGKAASSPPRLNTVKDRL